MPSCQLNITITGAGIGGLSAAIALRQAGHRVTIYEKSSLSHEVGQGITLSPNGGNILKQFGLDFSKARICDYAGRGVQNACTLETMSNHVDLEREMEKAYGLGMKAAYRIDLHAALVALARGQEGKGEAVKIVTRAGVERYDGDRGVITLDSGEVIEADLVVAADGVKSTAAAHINGTECPSLDLSDTIVYRFTLSKEQILADPLTEHLLDAGPGMCTFYIPPGAERFLIRYWCRDDGLQNFSLYCHHAYEGAGKQEEDSGLRFEMERTQVLREMDGFHPALKRVVGMATSVLPVWRCTTREPLKTLHRGRMVVIGDAAHPVKPYLGMGAVSAIEDAGILGALFSNLPESRDMRSILQQRLQLFNDMRVGRVAAYKYFSDIPTFAAAVEKQRLKCEAWMKSEDLPATQAELTPWRMGYDAVDDARKAIDQLPQINGKV